MENSQAVKLEGQISQPLELSDDHFWKALYSHTYTVQYKCINCENEFDIDGWFFKFEPVVCPKCEVGYFGIFGRVLHIAGDKSLLKIETFEGQQMDVPMPSGSRNAVVTLGHIVLVLLAKTGPNQNRPIGLIDYSESKPKLQAFNPAAEPGKEKSNNKEGAKPKSRLAQFLFG
jgi:hypothetical protein